MALCQFLKNKKYYIGWSAFKRRIFNPIELIFLALADLIMKAHCCQSISAGYLAAIMKAHCCQSISAGYLADH